MTDLAFAVVALVVVALGAGVSLHETGVAHRTTVQEWNAETDLVSGLPRWRRPIERRALRRQHTPEVLADLRLVHLHLLRWSLAFAAAALWVYVQLVEAWV